MKKLLFAMLGLMAFVAVLFAENKEIKIPLKGYPLAERHPLFEFARKHPEMRKEVYADGYLECLRKEKKGNWFISLGYRLKAIYLNNMSYILKSVSFETELDEGYYAFEAGLFELTEKEIDEANDFIRKGFNDCNREGECNIKADMYFYMAQADGEYCVDKTGGNIDENFMEPGNKWYELYQKFLKEDFKQ